MPRIEYIFIPIFSLCFLGMNLLLTNEKLSMAYIGAVINESIVAILTRVPISDIKKTKIIKVPTDSSTSQKVYPANFLKPSNFKDWFIALGEASKQVRVVLNIVVNAANDMKINIPSPRFEVYKLTNWPANSPPWSEKKITGTLPKRLFHRRNKARVSSPVGASP